MRLDYSVWFVNWERLGEHLVPFVRELVPAVDVPGGRVVLDPPEGLFDL